MMDFKEFTTRAEQDIRAALEDASPGVGVGMNQVEKLQGESYTAITLTPEGTNIGMNLNLNQLYDRMQRGESYDSILQAAVDQAKEHLSNIQRLNMPSTNWRLAKQQNQCLLVAVQGLLPSIFRRFETLPCTMNSPWIPSEIRKQHCS